MLSGIRFAACLACVLALAGCASNDLLVKRQSEAEAGIERLNQAEKFNMQRMNALSAQVQLLEDKLRESSELTRQLQSSLQELRSSQEGLKARLASVSQQAVQKIEVVNQEPSVRVKDSGPPADYVKAFGYYSANNYTAAIEAFMAFLKHNPQSDYAANASYWIGECYYSQSELARARDSFQKTVDSYPRSAKRPDAMLKLGYTLMALKQKEKGLAMFETIIRTYPGSPAALKARERLSAN